MSTRAEGPPRDEARRLVAGAWPWGSQAWRRWAAGSRPRARSWSARAPRRPRRKVATWTGWLKRGTRWFPFPDPPGDGPWRRHVRARSRVAPPRIRMRGHRVTWASTAWTRRRAGAAGSRSPRDRRARLAWVGRGPPPEFGTRQLVVFGDEPLSGNGAWRGSCSPRTARRSATYLAYSEADVWIKSSAGSCPGAAVAQGCCRPDPAPALAGGHPDRYRVRVLVRSFGGGCFPTHSCR
jgi:hypothetical protein